jgi:hypothetical protein
MGGHVCTNTCSAQRLREYLGYEGQLFGRQQVVECQGETRPGGLRNQNALTYDHTGAVDIWTKSEVPAGAAPADTAVQEAGRELGRGGARAVGG